LSAEDREPAQEQLAAELQAMKLIIYGDEQRQPREELVRELREALLATGCFTNMCARAAPAHSPGLPWGVGTCQALSSWQVVKRVAERRRRAGRILHHEQASFEARKLIAQVATDRTAPPFRSTPLGFMQRISMGDSR
jgi:hypothetical protein